MERSVDKALSTQKQRAVEEHFKTCAKCRENYADRSKIKSLFLKTPPPPAPHNLTTDIMRKIRCVAADKEKRNERTFMQWWKEAAIPVRMAVTVALFIVFAASFFVSRDLWNTPGSKVYPEYTEFDTFSESQKASLESVYFELITMPPPSQRGER
jgi:hypothetical protein